MLGVDSRALKAVWTCFLFALTIALIYVIRSTLVTFALSLFLALLLAPVVSQVEQRSPQWLPRTAALTIVYVVLLAAVAAVITPLGTAIAEDARALAVRLPDAMSHDFLASVPLPGVLEPWRERIVEIGRAHV